MEFVRMRGPQAKGFAEMAVSRVRGSGPETPDLENFPMDDFEDDSDLVCVEFMSNLIRTVLCT